MYYIEHRNVKPCPFCGSNAVVTDLVGGYKLGAAMCADCGATSGNVSTGYDESDNAEWRNNAIDVWNTRK